ncbi:hypothetical protein [Streptomyces sp. A1-5]|uniref:hypothetical protein n=1 Tax=Streptomyces sp. A1-5 TaxID=2738410 RepID=UPI001F363042|nr:hypothetical protein [Streptomyces sp. A1-5]UJB43598.1 hypothetical protein HRD51_24880 [Streptomyces sp. A1-5]
MSDETQIEAAPEAEETTASRDAVTEAPATDMENTNAELERLRAQLAEYTPIVQAHQEAEEARKTDEQKLRDELETTQRERDEARRGLLLREVAEETGLPADVVALIQGATRDELRSAASVIAERTKSTPTAPKRPTPTVGAGTDAPPTDSDDIDPVKLARAIAKRVRF